MTFESPEGKISQKDLAVYKNIVLLGELKVEQAREHIRARIMKEREWKAMQSLADQYWTRGEYLKAKNLLEKLVEETQKDMLK